jgi:peptidyl-dipeptidase A
MLDMRIAILLLCSGLGTVVVVFGSHSAAADPSATERARAFLKSHEDRVRPLECAVNLAWWAANTSGKDEDFKGKAEAQNRLDAALSDKNAFHTVKEIKEGGGIDDPVLSRAIDVIYLAYLEKQVDPALLKQMVAKINKVDQAFNNYRARVAGKELADSDVRAVLKRSTSSADRQSVWEASKGVGAVVEKDLKELVGLRNEAARQLGFKNFHALQLFLNEQDGADLIKLFDELDDLTRGPFQVVKADIDAKLAANCRVPVADLMPWHYHDPFFQEPPAVFAADLDEPFKKADLLQLTRTFYQGIGLPVDNAMARSDLFERKGKNPHAFCTDLDRQGDVRVLANVVPNLYWMSTLLHEFGHSVYSSKNIPASLPYTLRLEAHILTTEGVAMMFERVAKRRAWLSAMGVPVSSPTAFEEAGARMQRAQLLIFSRWCQVMLRFEKSMYENPDQDLNKLWWDLVEKYQLLKRPSHRNAPDYASKIHIVSTPVYYHNYMMGELFASQVHHAICRQVMNGADPRTVVYVDNKAVGDFMKKRVFDPGRTLKWNDLTRSITGDDLSPQAFAEDFKTN